ncbi:MAG: hypothetical protein QOF62_1824 [Pyrinomonadaceae bacterium]|jgi:uncharacterized protein YdaT|nr:hypothetical protein [Pyrinomonadaceae bacterium]
MNSHLKSPYDKKNTIPISTVSRIPWWERAHRNDGKKLAVATQTQCKSNTCTGKCNVQFVERAMVDKRVR